MYLQLMKKEDMDLEERMEGYMGGLGEQKWRGEMMQS